MARPNGIRFGAALRAVLPIELSAWYLAILGPTLIAKAAFLRELYPGGGLRVALASLGVVPTSLAWWTDGVLFFATDVLEVFAVVLVLFGVSLLVRGRLVLVSLTTFLAIALLGANLFCYRQVGSLLTPEILEDATRWTWREPSILAGVLTARHGFLLLLAGVWAGLPAIALYRASTAPAASVERSLCAGVAGACLVTGVAAIASTGWPARSGSPLQGYWSGSLMTFVGQDKMNPAERPLRAPDDVRESFRRLSYLGGAPGTGGGLGAAKLARHVVVVALETAPRKYYPITERDDLPAFRRMRDHGIVSDLHYAAAPSTAPAIYAIVSGTYPPRSALPNRFGEFRTDGLATVLAAHGYETTYVDSYTIDWAGRGDDRMLASLGFARLVESDAVDGASYYEQSLARERRSFERALQSIVAASGRGQRAFVCIATSLGHYSWRAPPGEEENPASVKLERIVRALDDVFAEFLGALDARGLGSDVMIVVTGDHGLRMKAEFDSLGEKFPDDDLTYNVPLLVYLPGALSQSVRLRYPTSHVDIEPTVLDFLGIPRQTLLLHGENVLDPDLGSRAVFLTGGGLYPIESFRWLDRFYSLDLVTGNGRAVARSGGAAAASLSEPRTAAIVREADDLFEATAGIFLRRGARSDAR